MNKTSLVPVEDGSLFQVTVSRSLVVLALEACQSARPYLPEGSLAAEENLQLAACCVVVLGGDCDLFGSPLTLNDLDSSRATI